MKKNNLIVVVGATASGKTARAVALAQQYNTVVVSADSRQIYAEMQIGTARPTAAEMQGVPHFFLGNKSIQHLYTAGEYEREVLALLDTLFEQHETVVVCGGTGLYINALCNGLDYFPVVSEAIKTQLQADFGARGMAVLQAELAAADPEYASTADLQNPQRLLRALEVCRATGAPYSSFRTQAAKPRPFVVQKIGIEWARADLYARIDARVEQMLAGGLLAEAERLYPHRYLNALQTVGYSELFDYMDGKTDLRTATERIKQHTRNYAKRQLTWFKKDQNTLWQQPENQ